ncbi:AraC family transcriptional regulator [Frankia sp. CN6]|uniref:AraC family transcriptional regulator n=2 Tax=Frankia nepalensis TaxID=1836974 RepID=A0A937URR2_9ACTN|nr:helix-turn-helix domain-containing protein [Frankia nepalensis]MBL7631393.1 AraC family transcriptional regulator [Frankia nepalensis]
MVEGMDQPFYRERPGVSPGSVVWRGAGTPGTTRRILPDGCMDLIWTGRGLLVAGPDSVAHEHRDDSGAVYTGLRFAPGTAPAVLGVPAEELRDLRVPLDELWPSDEASRLTERVAASPTPGRALESLTLAAARDPRHPGLVEPLAATITASLAPGQHDATPSVAATAARVALSERQLHRRCRAAFGYGPKTLARILRFRHALALAAAGVPFATAASAAGYADQPHLSRDVHALAGTSLGELVAVPAPPA